MATKTETKAKTDAPAQAAPAAQPPAQRRTGQEIAIARPRLPYPGRIVEDRFGVDAATWRAVCESVFPLARTPEAIILALSYCRAKRLDVMKKVCHIVPMWNTALNREVETVWPGIAELRTTAFRTAQYAGARPTEFGPWIEHEFEATKPARGNKAAVHKKKRVRFPEWARVTVLRHGIAGVVEFPGPTIYFREAFGYDKGVAVPNERWSRAPSQMLEKCAEAAALRKAFPEEFGDDWTAEEMEDRLTTVPPAGEAARPAPAEFVASPEDDGPPQDGVQHVDEVEGEVIEPEEEAEDEAGESLAQETARNTDRAKPTAPQPQAEKPADKAPAPAAAAQEEPEDAEEENGEHSRGTSAPPLEDEEAESKAFKEAEVFLKRAVEGLLSSDLKTEEDFNDYGERTKSTLKAWTDLSDDERDDLRARFVSALLNRKRDVFGARRGR